MSFRNENIDGLSSLPDEVVSHILSLMPTKFAVRTSSLSKRWRYTWMLVTSFNFDFDDIHPINGRADLDRWLKIVDRTLELCKTSQLNLFRLHISFIPLRKSTISKWINEAIRLNVCELDIKAREIELPLSLFTCNTLTTLRFADFNSDRLDVFNLPSTVKLPGLKTLDISVSSESFLSAVRLIHGCPVLESLTLFILWRHDEEDYNFNIPTLRRLEIRTMDCSFINRVVLNLPNLEYLSLHADLSTVYVMEDLSSLVEATISFDFFESNHLMPGVFLGSPLPQFPNLKNLGFKDPLCSRWLQVIEILERCSKLEHLCIQEVEESWWIEPQSVPSCMVSSLTTMKITKCMGRRCEIEFLEYMLGNAEVLEKLTITCASIRMMDELWLYAELLKIQRASRYCEIHFVGKWINSTPN